LEAVQVVSVALSDGGAAESAGLGEAVASVRVLLEFKVNILVLITDFLNTS
jgi:hypothetical protein